MKKLISLLTVIILSTTAGISNIGGSCNKPDAPVNKKLNEQVAKDLGLIDSNNKSLVDFEKVYLWQTEDEEINPRLIDNKLIHMAYSLLNTRSKKAVSPESEDFLVNTLKCIKNNKGKFIKKEVESITCLPNKINPILSKKVDGSDYVVTGGTFTIQFMKGNEKLGDNYIVDLQVNDKDIIKPVIDSFYNVKITGGIITGIDFNLKNFFNEIPDFKVGVGTNNTKPANGDDLYPYLDQHGFVYEALELLNDFDKGDEIKIIVTGRNTTSNNSHWESGNSLKVKIHFGTIISKEYSLILP